MKRRCLVSAVALISGLSQAQNFSGFTSGDFGSGANQITVNGVATYESGDLRLTNSGQGFASGTAFLNSKVAISSGFDQTFRYDIPGGDGICFLINNSAAGLSFLGSYGGYLGYMQGDPSVLAIEFDNYENGGDDPIGIQVRAANAAPFGTAFGTLAQPVSGVHDVRIKYDGISLSTYFDNLVSPALVVNNIDFAPFMDESGMAYMGFSAGQASVQGRQVVSRWNVTPTPEPATCLVMFGGLLGLARLRRKGA